MSTKSREITLKISPNEANQILGGMAYSNTKISQKLIASVRGVFSLVAETVDERHRANDIIRGTYDVKAGKGIEERKKAAIEPLEKKQRDIQTLINEEHDKANRAIDRLANLRLRQAGIEDYFCVRGRLWEVYASFNARWYGYS